MSDKQDDEKQYDLKPVEMQMLNVMQDGYMNQISNFLSFIGLERLAYNVTPRTTYRVDGNHLFIREVTDDAPATDDGGADDVVSTSSDTAGALK